MLANLDVSNFDVFEPNNVLEQDLSVPFSPPQHFAPDLDPDPILPYIQIRPTQQHQLPGILSYSRLECYQVVLVLCNILVPAFPQQVYFWRLVRQSNMVKTQVLALLYCTKWFMTREKY